MKRLFLLVVSSLCKIHHLELEDDTRLTVDLSSFVYNEQGFLNVTFNNFQIDEEEFQDNLKFDKEFKQLYEGDQPQFGFIFERLHSRGNVKYEKKAGDQVGQERCLLYEPAQGLKSGDGTREAYRQIIQARFIKKEYEKDYKYHLNMTWNSLVDKGLTLETIDLFQPGIESDTRKRRAPAGSRRDDTSTADHLRLEATEGVEVKSKIAMIYSFTFTWKFSDLAAAGLYELSFHNCYNRMEEKVRVSIDMELTEMNGEHYLGVGEVQFAMVYGFMSVCFLVAGFGWLAILRRKNQTVFKIHWLMFMLVLFKALSLMFHAVDYRFLDLEGQSDAWTIIFYIVHLLKGAILIVTLTLIGTGWTFIKYVLSEKEKKLFMLVLPLQILVNIAFIIHYESEEGTRPYSTWSSIMILLDMLCYAFILFPVYWSIRHLQQASLTDGKAQRSMEKLELFRSFLAMFVLYIYFTRMVVYIMRITLRPDLAWVAEFSNELATLAFFCVTGYKFRPGCNNPYFQMDEESVEVLTKSALTENVSKRKSKKPEARNLLESDSEEETILDAQTIV